MKLLPPPGAPISAPPGSLADYCLVLRRRLLGASVIALAGLLAGILYTLPQTPVYRGLATIEIQNGNDDVLRLRDLSPSSGPPSSWDPALDLQTQVRILQSRALVDRVARKLDLAHRPVTAPPFPAARWSRAFHLRPPRFDAARDLRVRAQAATRLIEISADSTDPRLAADFANTLATEFIEQNLEARWQTTRHTGEWLQRQMEDVRSRLERAEHDLQAYATQSGLLFTQEKDNVAEQRLRPLQEELSKAQADRISRQSRFELASRAAVDSIAEVLDDGSLRDLHSKLTDLRRQNAELSSTYTPAHPRVKKVEAQIRELESTLARERANILARIRNDFESARRRENLLAADYNAALQVVAAQAAKVTHYDILKREVDTDRQLYDSMLQRVKEAGIASALRASNVRVVDPAVPPALPCKPNLAANAAIGLLAGLSLALVFVVMRERGDHTLHDPGDATTFLGLPELGTVPSALLEAAPRHAMAHSTELVTLRRKPSQMAESVRATLASILYAAPAGDGPRVIVISSAGPKEGKTTLATNLAIALAEIDRQVLLIDADLRRPRLNCVFDLANTHGLVDALSGHEPLDSALTDHARYSGVPNLWVMTSGAADESAPSLLHSARLADLLDQARRQFEMVLIDAPPMLTIADARIIARHTDGVVLVARANETSRDSLQDACRRLTEDGTHILGAVLNDWNPKHSSRYSHYYHRYTS